MSDTDHQRTSPTQSAHKPRTAWDPQDESQCLPADDGEGDSVNNMDGKQNGRFAEAEAAFACARDRAESLQDPAKAPAREKKRRVQNPIAAAFFNEKVSLKIIVTIVILTPLLSNRWKRKQKLGPWRHTTAIS